MLSNKQEKKKSLISYMFTVLKDIHACLRVNKYSFGPVSGLHVGGIAFLFKRDHFPIIPGLKVCLVSLAHSRDVFL